MKKLLFFVLCMFFYSSIFSQTLASAEGDEKTEEKIEPSEHGEKKFAVNIFYNPATFVPLSHKSPSVNNFFGADIFYHTPKTYHYLGYDIFQNAITSTNGYLITDHIGSYIFFSNSFKQQGFEEGELVPNKAISTGIEYFFESKYIDLIFYSEFGTDFNHLKDSFKENFFSVGMIFEGHAFRF